jgi:hypothetical protein
MLLLIYALGLDLSVKGVHSSREVLAEFHIRRMRISLKMTLGFFAAFKEAIPTAEIAELRIGVRGSGDAAFHSHRS